MTAKKPIAGAKSASGSGSGSVRAAGGKNPKTPRGPAFPIVGLGASAGGLQAVTAFLEAVPPESGMAFVLIHHVDPDHKSLMAELLAKHTAMTVCEAADEMTVKPDHVYVIPPNSYLEIKGGVLRLFRPADRRGSRLPIDRFLKSLAHDRERAAVAVILSGTGSDGSGAIGEIKDKGGIVLVQDPNEAQHDGMPRSAIATGAVDRVVPVAQMPKIIVKYGDHPFVKAERSGGALGAKAKAALPDIIALLKAYSPVNFDLYKDGTLLRRIERRMALRHLQDPAAYLAVLRETPEEAENLCQDLLISVTSFFRDAEAFEYLDQTILADLARSHRPGQPVRIWVPACATGQEAYSLAMLVIERISELGKDIKVQVFASDLDERALAVAREGVYSDGIEDQVSPERLARFFVREDHSYRVTPELRDAVVFANQNVLADAPFSRLDLISCRNLMIYLTPEAQERVLEMFHFALNEGGILFLGSSETIGSAEPLFGPVSRKHRIYQRLRAVRARHADLPIARRPLAGRTEVIPRTMPNEARRLAEISQRVLIESYAPAAVLVDGRTECLYFEGPVDQYIKVPTGEVNRDLLAMVRDGLRAQLSRTIRSADNDGTRVSGRATVTRNGRRVPVSITVHPVVEDETRLFLVAFADIADAPDTLPEPEGSTELALEQELETTRADLRDTIRDYERTTEELRAVNEEAMSMNEEFQSTNEELETSKEELQSLNEELTTLNTQLQQKIEDERRLSDDLNNLLSSSGIATLFLDRDMNVMRFTPATRTIFNLISKDIGRSFSDITGKVDDPTLLSDAAQVLETLETISVEVKAEGGKWFNRRVGPYCTAEGKVVGIVATFADVTELKTLEVASQKARGFAESIVNTVREPLIVVDASYTTVSVSRSFCDVFRVEESDVVGQKFFEIKNGQWDLPDLRRMLDSVFDKGGAVDSFELALALTDQGSREILLNARRLLIDGAKDNAQVLLAMEDITERNRSRRNLIEREARLSAILEAVPEAIITIDTAGIIKSYSPPSEQLMGYSPHELIGQNVRMLMPEPHRAHHDDYIATYLKTGVGKIIGKGRDLEARHKDGTLVPMHLKVAEIAIGGKPHFLGIMHDMTNEQKRREQLQRAQKMEAIGQLTGGIAHDFNNLLTVVIGNLELLEMRTTDDQVLNLTGEALDAANLGATLTNKLLSFSRSQPLTPEAVDMNALVRTVGPLLQRTLGELIEVKTSLSEKLKPVQADPGQIENALLNMAINARDAMPEGGALMIETSLVVSDADNAAGLADAEPGSYVALSVSDTGVGISPDVIEHVFEPFFTTKDAGRGSGLGLSMVYGFAKQSGGHVTIHSEVGQGTTICLYLPLAESSVQAAEGRPPVETEMSRSETVLLVEDDPRVRRLTIERLQQLGYKVLSAQNGPEALQVLEQADAIDLVLSDVVMPGGMSGVDLAGRISVDFPDIKILLTSGYVKDNGGAQGGATAKAYPMLRKPYGMDELARALRERLD
jgi:two-component system CheB/CheR fusion protein